MVMVMVMVGLLLTWPASQIGQIGMLQISSMSRLEWADWNGQA
jgi:hypothetical protein